MMRKIIAIKRRQNTSRTSIEEARRKAYVYILQTQRPDKLDPAFKAIESAAQLGKTVKTFNKTVITADWRTKVAANLKNRTPFSRITGWNILAMAAFNGDSLEYQEAMRAVGILRKINPEEDIRDETLQERVFLTADNYGIDVSGREEEDVHRLQQRTRNVYIKPNTEGFTIVHFIAICGDPRMLDATLGSNNHEQKPQVSPEELKKLFQNSIAKGIPDPFELALVRGHTQVAVELITHLSKATGGKDVLKSPHHYARLALKHSKTWYKVFCAISDCMSIKAGIYEFSPEHYFAARFQLVKDGDRFKRNTVLAILEERFRSLPMPPDYVEVRSLEVQEMPDAPENQRVTSDDVRVPHDETRDDMILECAAMTFSPEDYDLFVEDGDTMEGRKFLDWFKTKKTRLLQVVIWADNQTLFQKMLEQFTENELKSRFQSLLQEIRNAGRPDLLKILLSDKKVIEHKEALRPAIELELVNGGSEERPENLRPAIELELVNGGSEERPEKKWYIAQLTALFMWEQFNQMPEPNRPYFEVLTKMFGGNTETLEEDPQSETYGPLTSPVRELKDLSKASGSNVGFAARCGHDPFVDKDIAIRGWKKHRTHEQKVAEIHEVAKFDHPTIFQKLTENREMEDLHINGRTILMAAVDNQQRTPSIGVFMHIINALYEKGIKYLNAELERVDEHGKTVLHYLLDKLNAQRSQDHRKMTICLIWIALVNPKLLDISGLNEKSPRRWLQEEYAHLTEELPDVLALNVDPDPNVYQPIYPPGTQSLQDVIPS